MRKFIFILPILLIGCKDGVKEKHTHQQHQNTSKHVTKELSTKEGTLKDTIPSAQASDTLKKVFNDKELQASHQKIVEKYGEQWSFCKCVRALDSITKKIEQATGDTLDQLFEESKKIDRKCMDRFLHPNRTPEQREAYQKRVSDCLKSANL